jgi:hypothetical protein
MLKMANLLKVCLPTRFSTVRFGMRRVAYVPREVVLDSGKLPSARRAVLAKAGEKACSEVRAAPTGRRARNTFGVNPGLCRVAIQLFIQPRRRRWAEHRL